MNAPDRPRVSITEAAARLDMDARKLRGDVWNSFVSERCLRYPLGSLETDEIYAFEVERLTKERQG